MNESFDVLIIGGGLVGASLAIALDGAGLRVALAEAAPPRVDLQPSHDERNLVLARVSVNALEALGVLDAATPAIALRRIHVSRRGDFGAVRLDAVELGLPAFGAVLPARELGNALLRRLDACARLVRIAPAQAVAIEPGEGEVAVELRGVDGSRRVRTRLLVGADGSESFVRSAAGIEARRHDYAQSAFVTTLSTEQPLDGGAYERFTDSGPVALLPLGERRAGLVLSVPTATRSMTPPSSPSCTSALVGVPVVCRTPGGASRTRSPACSPPAPPRRARCWSATPRRPCTRSARKASTWACAMH